MNIRSAKRIISLAAALACMATSGLPAAADSSAHEPITMVIAYQSGDEFLSLLHEKYPEIDLQFVAYNGTNTTEFLNEMLAADEMTDIYMKTYYSPQREDLSDRLLDLSGYAFTDKYAQARIREISDEGAIYLLPFFTRCIGITYNATLLEENGWTLPTSFKELEELAPKVKEAGYNLCLNQIQYPGYGFQYLCNIADTGYLSTLSGRKWQADFLSGKVSLSGSQEMLDCMAMLQRWRDVGMLNGDGDPYDDEKTRERMAQGDTLFMLGSSNGIADADSEYTFKLMPYLSENGDQNTYVLQTARYYGLNKKLGEAGNEQKLEDALHVLDVFSTQEGMNALMGRDRQNSSLLPLKDYEISEDNYYYNIKDEIDSRLYRAHALFGLGKRARGRWQPHVFVHAGRKHAGLCNSRIRRGAGGHSQRLTEDIYHHNGENRPGGLRPAGGNLLWRGDRRGSGAGIAQPIYRRRAGRA